MSMASQEADGTLHIALVNKQGPDSFHGFPKLSAAGESLRRILSGKGGAPSGGGRVSASGSDAADSCAPETPSFASPAAATTVATPLSSPATPIAAPVPSVAECGGAACLPLAAILDGPLLEAPCAASRWEATPDNAWDDAAAFRAGWERGYDSDAASECEDWATLPARAPTPADACYLAALGAAAAARAPMSADSRFAPTEGNPLDDSDAFAAGFETGAAPRGGRRFVSILGHLDASYGNPLEQPGFAAGYEAGYESD